MAQSYFFVRGEKDRVAKWKNDIGAQWMPIKYLDDKGKIINGHVQVAVRTVELVEIAYPNECEADIMGLIQPQQTYTKAFRIFEKMGHFIGKVLGLKKPMKESEWKKTNLLYKNYIHAFCIGKKDDVIVPLIETDAKADQHL